MSRTYDYTITIIEGGQTVEKIVHATGYRTLDHYEGGEVVTVYCYDNPVAVFRVSPLAVYMITCPNGVKKV